MENDPEKDLEEYAEWLRGVSGPLDLNADCLELPTWATVTGEKPMTGGMKVLTVTGKIVSLKFWNGRDRKTNKPMLFVNMTLCPSCMDHHCIRDVVSVERIELKAIGVLRPPAHSNAVVPEPEEVEG